MEIERIDQQAGGLLWLRRRCGPGSIPGSLTKCKLARPCVWSVCVLWPGSKGFVRYFANTWSNISTTCTDPVRIDSRLLDKIETKAPSASADGAFVSRAGVKIANFFVVSSQVTLAVCPIHLVTPCFHALKLKVLQTCSWLEFAFQNR